MTQNALARSAWFPPENAEVVQRGSLFPLGTYRTPDGQEVTALAFPQPVRDALDAIGYAGGMSQDPAAPPGYVSQNALIRGGQGLAESAMVGSLASRAPAGALRSGAARGAGELDQSQAARMARAREMGFEEQPQYRGLSLGYSSNVAGFKPQWFSNSPEVANSYTNAMTAPEPQVMAAYIRPGNAVEIDAGGAHWTEIPLASLPDGVRGQIKPASSVGPYSQMVSTEQVVRQLRGPNQPDTIRFRNIYDHGLEEMGPLNDVTVVLNPANVRARTAMFDPERMNDADILAANPMAGAVPLAFPAPDDRRRNALLY